MHAAMPVDAYVELAALGDVRVSVVPHLPGHGRRDDAYPSCNRGEALLWGDALFYRSCRGS